MIIYWQIGDKSGHGEPTENKLAQIWVDFMNNIYGPNTHWCKNYTKDVERNLASKCNAGRFDGAYPHGKTVIILYNGQQQRVWTFIFVKLVI